MKRPHVRRGTAVSTGTLFSSAVAVLMSIGSLGSFGSCTGAISDPGGSAGTTSPLCRAGAIDPGPSYIRRVTRLEYNNTVRDLLGDTSGVANGFPTEEKRLGFDNNADALSVSPVLAEQYMLAAETLSANAVASNLGQLVPCDPAADGVDACGQQFIATFGRRAFRRPLTPDDVALLTTVFDAGKSTDFATGVRLVIATALQTPQFLYRVEFGVAPARGQTAVKLDDWEMASRLSYLLWNTMPDDTLFAAAEAGRLTAAADVDAQVERMLADPRARGVVADFNTQWLRIAEFDTAEKDGAVFPAFNAGIAALMHQETARFMDYVTWDGDGDLGAMFTAPFTFVNGPLAQYYGIPGVTGSAFVQTPVADQHRAGVLTQGGILSLLGKANQTSPVHRGKFVREQLLCTDLPPPPADLVIKPPELSATLTTRERFSQHAADNACAGCHHLMDPIGLGFESFDGAGVFRATENGQPVDSTGNVLESDVAGPFDGAIELQAKLAASDQVRACVATKWFRYGYGRGETDGDACSLGTIKSKFAAGGYKMRDLLRALTQTNAFLYRQVTPAAGGTS
jgi:hypothetical protein